MEPRVSIRNLDFYYGATQALKSVSIDFPDRQTTAMIGPSGCGKSTLLRVLNRMYDLYPGQRAEGEVILDGENILDPRTDINRLRRRVGMVFQKPTPFPKSIYDNVLFGVRLHERLSKAEMDERVEWALSRAALWNEVKDRLHSSALDPISTLKIEELIDELKQDFTIVIVTHNMLSRTRPYRWR